MYIHSKNIDYAHATQIRQTIWNFLLNLNRSINVQANGTTALLYLFTVANAKFSKLTYLRIYNEFILSVFMSGNLRKYFSFTTCKEQIFGFLAHRNDD